MSGDPVPVPLHRRDGSIVGYATIDAADAEMVLAHRWRRTAFGYAITGSVSKDTDVLMHRMLLGLARGDRRQGDHRNGDRLDNRRSNLRVVTNAQNSQNQRARGGSSRHRGVSRRADTGRWVGYATVDGRRYRTKCFDTEEQARAAAAALRQQLMPFDEPARHA